MIFGWLKKIKFWRNRKSPINTFLLQIMYRFNAHFNCYIFMTSTKKPTFWFPMVCSYSSSKLRLNEIFQKISIYLKRENILLYKFSFLFFFNMVLILTNNKTALSVTKHEWIKIIFLLLINLIHFYSCTMSHTIA